MIMRSGRAYAGVIDINRTTHIANARNTLMIVSFGKGMRATYLLLKASMCSASLLLRQPVSSRAALSGFLHKDSS